MRRLAFVALPLAAFLAAACATNTAHDPAVAPISNPTSEREVFGSIKTIALDPVSASGLPEDLRAVDLGRGKFDSLVSAELAKAGFQVVSGTQAEAIWERVEDSVGGAFDATTGALDTKKITQIRTRTMDELQSRFHADAWLHVYIVVTKAKFHSGKAKWDGATQSFGKKFLGMQLSDTYGTTTALSISLVLEDMQGKTLYQNTGGLQLYDVPSGDGFVRVRFDQVYADRARNRDAVRLALGQLIAGTSAQTATN